jgi:MFS family permease
MVIGRLGDMYGHKRLFIIGWAWLSLWSLLAGFSRDSGLTYFSICRAFQGIGSAILIPNAIAIIGTTLPAGTKRNIAFACFGAAGPTGAAVSALVTSVICEQVSWVWCFWALSITCAVLVLISYLTLPTDADISVSKEPKESRFDWAGAVTGVAGLLLINFALNQAPIVGWQEPYIYALLILGVLLLVAFVWIELKHAHQSLIPLRGLQMKAVFSILCVFAGWSSHGIWVYYLYILLEHLRGHSALLASAETSPVAITGVFFAFSVVWLLRKVSVSFIMLISMLAFFIGSLVLALTPLEQPYWANTFVAILLMPAAMNLSFPAATILLSSALPKEDQGIAASLVATMVNYSIATGLGLAGTLHRHVITDAAHSAGLEDPDAPLSISTPELVAVRFLGSQAAYWFAVALSGLGIIMALFFMILTKEITSAKEKGIGDTRSDAKTAQQDKNRELYEKKRQAQKGVKPWV